MNQALKDYLAEKKPDASQSTLKTYTSILSTFAKKALGKDATFEAAKEYLEDVDKVLENQNEDAPLSSRKTLMSALYAMTGDKQYHSVMMSLSSKHTSEIRKQEKNEKQEENWMSFSEVMEVVEKYRKDTARLFQSKEPLQGYDLMKAQQYLILALTTGVFIPPRRSLDWTDMNIRNAEPTNNYIDKSKFHFVTYKTAKTYGEQTVEMPRKLRMLLTKWMRINPSDHLLVNMDYTRMQTSRLTRELNAIFGKNISTSLLRNIYVTEKFGHMPKLTDMEDVAEKMAHDVSMQMKYIKR